MKRYTVGIDLGTSHTACAYAPLEGRAADIALLPIPQRLSAGEVQAQPLLPSARYQAAPGELGEAWRQPWPPLEATDDTPATLGRWARDLGAAVPGRLVESAKSWLSHPGVDRTAPILPWGAPQDVARVSPVQASASYLAHVRAAWDAAHPDAPLHAQDLVLTVPASFDEGARALTLEAARLAGLPALQLLEEPKAAFHDWLALQGEQLAAQLAGCRLVLVVDVGGGTTDLTLIRVDTQAGGTPRLTRIAVGEHLMLGGDNMDLALAHLLEPQFAGDGGHLPAARLPAARLPAARLPAARFAQLVQRCRQAKELLLADGAPDSAAVTLLGAGSRMLAQTHTATLTRAQVLQCVVEGFLPQVPIGDRPARRQGALRGLGLPYPADAAITRHLAQFLAQHAGGDLPDTLLLNGGVFRAPALVQRVTEVLAHWRGAMPRVLHNPHPDWAVARGAAAYGLAQHSSSNTHTTQSGQAPAAPKTIVPRIGGGSARSYWLVLPGKAGTAPQGICLLPRGTEEGVRLVLTSRRFALRLGQAVRFALVARSQGQAQAGQIAPLEGDGWAELPPLATVLPAPEGRATAQVEVQLQACMTEVGTLEVRCVATQDADQSWLLPFAVRGAAGTDGASKSIASRTEPESVSGQKGSEGKASRLPQALALIDRIFGTQAQDVAPREVRQLRQSLEKILGPRAGWDVALLRALFDALLARARRRRRTPEHERTWLNLAGWCLRPGVGAELDAWRIAQVWQLYPQGLGHGQDAANWTEWWVFWRRVAAGLDEAQQMQVLEAVAGCMQKTVQRSQGKAAWGSYDDMLRLFAAMEAVPWQYRQEMGQWMLQRLLRPDESAQTWWAIGRLAARQPLAANAHRVMPPEAAAEFLHATLREDWRHNEHALFAAVQIARMTGDRARDLPDALRTEVLEKMRATQAPARWIALVEQPTAMEAEDQQRSLGDSLPPGLVLVG